MESKIFPWKCEELSSLSSSFHLRNMRPFLFFVWLSFAFSPEHAGSQFPDHRWNPRPVQWKHRVLTTGPPGKSQFDGILTHTFLLITTSPNLHLHPQQDFYNLLVFTSVWNFYDDESFGFFELFNGFKFVFCFLFSGLEYSKDLLCKKKKKG